MTRDDERATNGRATNAPRPRVITKSDPTRIAITWTDGHESVFAARRLRDLCPCARCVDEHTGRPIHDPRSTPDGIVTEHVALVGNYALTVRFSDGHDTGIFTYRFLREHDPEAPEARA